MFIVYVCVYVFKVYFSATGDSTKSYLTPVVHTYSILLLVFSSVSSVLGGCVELNSGKQGSHKMSNLSLI